MAIMTRDRETDGGEFGLAKHTIGNALVVYPVGNMTKAAQNLALNVAADTENDLVVVDLPVSSPIWMWESVAQVLPKRRRGVRLVIGGRSRETTALAGHWLAERLKRTVLVPDGLLLCGAGGTLFVHSGPSSGWVRCSPGKPPRLEAKRFPRPQWDAALMSENFLTSARGVAEQLPSGIWIRPIGDDPQLRANRLRLIETMPCQPDLISVVLGSPGGVPLSENDVALMWRELPEHLHDRVRFVQYGPMSVPRGELGQTLADALGREIIFFAGMPIGPAVAPEIFTVRQDGTLGWHAFARELKYQPRSSEAEMPKVPTVVTHRAPFPGVREVSRGIYWYSVDAVVEVVQSGLLVRPPAATTNVEAIQAIPTDPATHNLMYEAETEADLARMEHLASELSQRLGNSVRPMSRVLHARSLLNTQARPFSQVAAGFADTLSSAGIFDQSEEASIAALPASVEMTTVIRAVSGPYAESVGVEAVGPERDRAQASGSVGALSPDVVAASDVFAVPEVARAEIASGIVSTRLDLSRPGVVAARLDAVSPTVVSPQVDLSPPVASYAAVAPPVIESAPLVFDAPVQPAGLGVGPVAVSPAQAAPTQPAAEPMLEAEPARQPEAEPAPEPLAVAEPAPQPAAEVTLPAQPVAQSKPAVADIARLQPVPAPEATGLLPKRGIADERAWLRRTLAAEFGVLSNSVARILSEHPGFQGALSASSSEVLTDAVAVQLYLTDRGKAVDDALRTAAVGPHVPFARCVVSGLSRLPSHRGPAVFGASPTPGEWDLYREHKLLTEWGFLHALTGLPADQTSEVDVLVWSMTARRTKLLEGQSGVKERVLFVPGTSFKVLEMTEPQADGARGQILLRELTAVEIDADGRVDPNRISLDELALNSLRRQAEQWAGGAQQVEVDPAAADRFGALPGLA
ncbi:hypothetical protein SAMN04488564_1245 [Lentzea waywayandensis]|uniref:Uncharacterized protein n=1 Tax=Lentzea waywayandensis TaxID=84724 RepID=A0A1I6FJ06_9PSEU|nr:hypothetical protein [Lentzea waywayandensis]SFR29912.1 hypothetical protein SAMN04488564_1245 [Lentzea waywayandensis]